MSDFLRRARGWIVLGAFVVVVVVVAARTADDSPEVAIFAGVIVGAAVTAVVTWFLGPLVEARIRREARREAALSRMLELLLKASARDVFGLDGDLADDTVRALRRLRRLRKVAEELRLQGVAAQDLSLQHQVEEWRQRVYVATLTIGSLPRREPSSDGMRIIRVEVGGPLGRGGRRDELEDEATDVVEDLRTRTDGLIEAIIAALGVSAPPKVARDPDDPTFRTPAELRLLNSVATTVLAQLAENEGLAATVGREALTRVAGDDAAAMRLRWATIARRVLDRPGEDADTAVGALLLLRIARSDNQRERALADAPGRPLAAARADELLGLEVAALDVLKESFAKAE